MSESLNHWVTWFVQKLLIHSETKQVTPLNERATWIIESLDSFKTVDSFRNEAGDSLNERVTESLIHLIVPKLLIHFRNEAGDSLNERVTESLSHLIRSKPLIHSETKQVTLLMSESLNHESLDSFKNRWFIQKRSRWLSYWASHWINWVTWFVQNHWFIQKRSRWLSNERVTNHWVIDSFKTIDSFRNEAVTPLWTSHWITSCFHSPIFMRILEFCINKCCMEMPRCT